MMPTTQPPTTQNKIAGIFQYITHIDGTDAEVNAAQAQLANLTPQTKAIYQALNLLPNGELKSWLTANPVQFWKKIIQLFTGRKYTSKQYTLGQRLINQIQGGNATSNSQVPDDAVSMAQALFTMLFGVRITTQDDLDALQLGIDAYYARPDKSDIPQQAVNRAVFLKQNFYPDASYYTGPWDLSAFEKYPLVSPIPGVDFGTLYNGEVPGGAIAVNGIIPINAKSVLSQYVGATIDPATGTMQGIGGFSVSTETLKKYAPIIAALLVIGLIVSIKTGLFKPH